MRNDLMYNVPEFCTVEITGSRDKPAGKLNVAGGKAVDLYKIVEYRDIGEWPRERWARDEDWLHVDSECHVHRWKLVNGNWRVTKARYVKERCDGVCADPTHTYDSWRCTECDEKIIEERSNVGFRKEYGRPDRKPAPRDVELFTRDRLVLDPLPGGAPPRWLPAKLTIAKWEFTGEVTMFAYTLSVPGPSWDDKIRLQWRSRDEPGVIWERTNG